MLMILQPVFENVMVCFLDIAICTNLIAFLQFRWYS